MMKPPERILYRTTKQAVIVTPRGATYYPPERYEAGDWVPEKDLQRALKKAARLVNAHTVIGYAVYNTRHEWLVYGMVNGDAVPIPRIIGEDPVKTIQRWHRDLEKKRTTALRDLEKDLARHDWYYYMSDDGRVWRSGAAHRKEIEQLLMLVPRDEGRRLWQKYAPTKSKGGLIADDPYTTFKSSSSRTGSRFVPEGDSIGYRLAALEEAITRTALNKYNPTELIGQAIKVLEDDR